MSSLNVRPMESAEEEFELRELATQSFNFPLELWGKFVEVVGRENIRVAIHDNHVVGGMSFYPVGQWFGGQSVPMAGFALVLTGVEHRGEGFAYDMLCNVMRELRPRCPLATLYASTQPIYRKVGFEQAGNNYTYSLSLRDIRGAKKKCVIRRADLEADHAVLQSLANQYGAANNGCLERNGGMWKRLSRSLHGKVYAFLLGESGKERGYVIYDQRQERVSWSSDEQRIIGIRDLVALDCDAQETIWSLIASNRSVIDAVSWLGPSSDPRSLGLEEHKLRVEFPRRWMMRLLDVREALVRRGYPELTGQLAFEVTDDLFEDNTGNFTLSLEQGSPKIEEVATSSPIRISARDLAPLYSGLWTASQLRDAGKLACEDEHAIGLANQFFAGSEPWMPDAF